jgi:hypothetical protein
MSASSRAVGERPPSKADIKRFGDTALPEGPILAVRVADLGEKEVVLAAQRALPGACPGGAPASISER